MNAVKDARFSAPVQTNHVGIQLSVQREAGRFPGVKRTGRGVDQGRPEWVRGPVTSFAFEP
jgi:hypothetical protein